MDKIAEANAVISGLAFYPQLFRVIQTHSTAGLSITTVAIVCGTNIIWGIYGLHRKDIAIILSSTLVLLAIVPLSIMHAMWG